MSEATSDKEFETLIEFIRTSRGFDFSGYKPASLMRRVSKRMQSVATTGFSDYRDYLEVHPEEFVYLFNTVLINVTTFFRDPNAWEYLVNEIVPKILEHKAADRERIIAGRLLTRSFVLRRSRMAPAS